MKSALSLTFFVCVCGFATPLAAQQNRADADWSRVVDLEGESEIIVTTKGAPPARGYLLSADESGLRVLNLAQAVEDIARADIAQIKLLVPYSPGRDALNGAVVGGTAYGLIGLTLCRAFGGTESCAADFLKTAAVGGAITAGIAVAAGAIKHRFKPLRLVYRAP
jgi:hypothetical protein